MKKIRKTRNFICMLLVLSLMACLSAGCANTDSGDGTLLYYMNTTMTGLEAQSCTVSSTDPEEQIEELIGMIRSQEVTGNMQPLLQEGVNLTDYTYVDKQLFLYFDEGYAQMDATREVLCRGGIVSTLMQVSGIEGISFYVEGLPLQDEEGNDIGIMTEDTFVIEPGENIYQAREIELTLYFASASGDMLVSETRTVTDTSNSSKVRLVVEELLKGPEYSTAQASIPEDTEINSVTVLDGTCFVDFSEEFTDSDYEIDEDVIIYSIVNSLTALPSVTNVQISVNDRTDLTYRLSMTLDTYYEFNQDLVVSY